MLKHFYVESFSFFKEMALWSLRHRRQLGGKAVIFQNALFALFLSVGECNIMPSVWDSPIFPLFSLTERMKGKKKARWKCKA